METAHRRELADPRPAGGPRLWMLVGRRPPALSGAWRSGTSDGGGPTRGRRGHCRAASSGARSSQWVVAAGHTTRMGRGVEQLRAAVCCAPRWFPAAGWRRCTWPGAAAPASLGVAADRVEAAVGPVPRSAVGRDILVGTAVISGRGLRVSIGILTRDNRAAQRPGRPSCRCSSGGCSIASTRRWP